MRRSASTRAMRRLLTPQHWLRQMLFWGGALLVALGVILFVKACAFGNAVFASIVADHPYLPFLITPFGFASITWLCLHVFPGAEGSGIPQTLASLDEPDIANRASALSLRAAFGKSILTALGLCVGASVGPEGPSVHIGAAIMHTLGKSMPSPRIAHALILAGGAGGIAAAFNTPLAGILFVFEGLSRSVEEKTSGLVLVTVIIAGIVSMATLGNYSYFGHTNASLSLLQAWKPVLFCGLAGGLCGGSLARLLIAFARGVPGRIGLFIEEKPVLFAAIAGFVLAGLGFFCCDQVFGTGYSQAKNLIEGAQSVPLSFGFVKLVATAITNMAGLPGGLFAPSLAIGAGLGANLAAWIPNVPQAVVIILGAVGMFSGLIQVPITATIIVMEMVDDHSLTLPLMATAFLAMAVSRILCPLPFYHTLAQLFVERKTRRSIRRIRTQQSH